jgi:hypothetical protein
VGPIRATSPGRIAGSIDPLTTTVGFQPATIGAFAQNSSPPTVVR